MAANASSVSTTRIANLVDQEQSISLSSATSLGAVNKSADNSVFEVNLQSPISIGKNSYALTVELTSASLFYNTPNILTGINDQLILVVGGINRTIVFPQGLWSITDIATYVDSELTNINPAYAGLCVISPLYATDRVAFKSTNSAVFTDVPFNANAVTTAFGAMLGFSGTITFTSNNQTFYGTSPANLSQNLDYYLLHCDIVSSGLQFNNILNSIVSKIPITAQPGDLIEYAPSNPTKVDASNLRNNTRSTIRSWITDQLNRPIEMPDDWSFELRITWKESAVLV